MLAQLIPHVGRINHEKGPKWNPLWPQALFFCTSLLLSHTIINFPHFHLSFHHHLASKFFMICLVIAYYYPVFNTSLQHVAMFGLYLDFVNLENNSLLSLKLFNWGTFCCAQKKKKKKRDILLYHASILETVKPKSLLQVSKKRNSCFIFSFKLYRTSQALNSGERYSTQLS